MSLEPGDQIDVWVVEERLGAGGMGSVYRCHNAATTRILAAVKVLESPLRDSPEAHRRFLREAEILYRLDHPNIVRVRNIRMDASPPYLEMEFVEGRALEEEIREGPTPVAEALDLVAQVIEALVYMHGRGVRHRDIKPGNLLLTADGRVKLVDFGLAMETELGRITAEGLNFGTVSYAPPEWVDPATLDPVQWDLYAVGVLLYELLTGSYAFPLSGQGPLRKQLLQVMVHKQTAEPLDPGPRFAPEVRQLIQRLTAREKSDRPASAEEVQELLTAAAGSPSPALAETGPPAPVVSRPAPGRGLPLLVGLGLLAMVVGFGAVAVWGTATLRGGAVAVPEPEPDPAPVAGPTVTVQVGGVPAGLPVALRAGAAEAWVVDGSAVLHDPATAGELTWVAGEDCEACPGDACGAWCGVGSVPWPLEGDSLVLDVPTSTVTVVLPSLVDEVAKGPFKKRKPIWHFEVRVDEERADRPNHYTGTVHGVAPGHHRVIANIGGCAEADLGCWPDGTCPSQCRSAVEDVVVPWSADGVTLRIKVPPPS